MFFRKRANSKSPLPPPPPPPPTPPPPPLHKKSRLCIDTKFFVLIAENNYLRINSDTGKIEKDSDEEYKASKDARTYDIYGVLGFLELLSAIHIIVITERTNLGKIQGKDVYAIKRVAVIPLDFERAIKILERHPWPSDKEEDKYDQDDSYSRIEEHTQYVSSSVTENTIKVIDPSEISSLSLPPPSPTIVITPILPSSPQKQIGVLFSKVKSAISELGVVGRRGRRKRASSNTSSVSTSSDTSSPSSDSPLDLEDFEWDSVTPNNNFNNDVLEQQQKEKNSSSDILSAVGNLFLKDNNITTSPGTVDIKDPIDKKVMDARIARELATLFRSDAFFFSYELDITTSLQGKFEQKQTMKNQPLWKQAIKSFWWNEHMLQSFIELELHAWILPVMQGFVQIRPCEIDENVFDFIIISRRSRERAGLRYQRRGINEHGNVSNFVETEQIISVKDHEISFLQVRGSIPLFWSQSSYGLKPRPVLERSEIENKSACSKHFDSLIKDYGNIICINLVETCGREAVVGGAFREAVDLYINDYDNEYNDIRHHEKKIEYKEFDFHNECKGMKYENISKLVDMLEKSFNDIGYFWKAKNKESGDDEVHCFQKGIFRTNCMDCLDRTNVVQSSLARKVMNLQLLRLGISEFVDGGISHYEQFENIFNDVWANNGDSISREYAGTSALKGDFTRTGKRNLQGVFNDATNSIARLFQNSFKDFFRQASIDYLLGNHTIEVFQELQRKFEASQPGDAYRWAKVRTTAIDISSSIVILEDEERINGWTFLSPVEPNTLRGKSYEEKVLLLTKKALYVCTFHYRLEKVIQFKRIGLGEITCIEKGEYILSTFYASCVSSEDNYGFVIHYRASGESNRINSGSMRNNNNVNNKSNDGDKRYIAFKTFRNDLVGEATKFASGGGSGSENVGSRISSSPTNYSSENSIKKTSQQIVNEVVVEIVKACGQIGNIIEEGFQIERPIISLEEARKGTGIMAKVGFRFKQALWL
ncbi:hypothetical protein Glove_606g57 [Diversispora epigaea]|uniref:SAC domain-containing protein n=1 Tax=Diversispora epigaea TaxID=1348612 RepID=A0A397GCS3_9GLOM|nr:hypothetical protein Glove_606g57 [Diversispora epigaea]